MNDRKNFVDPTKQWLPEDDTGIKIWKNPKNSFAVFQLHYSADPEKNTPEWIATEKSKYDAQTWAREYELSWESYGGKSVYAGVFSRNLHVFEEDVQAEPSLPLVRGWDSGGLPACVIGQWVGRQFRILDEYYATEFKPSTLFVPEVVEWCNVYYPEHTFVDVVDPAAIDEGNTVGKVWVQDMWDLGLRPISGEKFFEARRRNMVELMSRLDGGEPCFRVNPRCDFIIRGCEGGYQYPERVSQRSKIAVDRPVPNEFSHIQTAIQYAVSIGHKLLFKVANRGQKIVKSMPKRLYAFQRRK